MLEPGQTQTRVLVTAKEAPSAPVALRLGRARSEDVAFERVLPDVSVVEVGGALTDTHVQARVQQGTCVHVCFHERMLTGRCLASPQLSSAARGELVIHGAPTEPMRIFVHEAVRLRLELRCRTPFLYPGEEEGGFLPVALPPGFVLTSAHKQARQHVGGVGGLVFVPFRAEPGQEAVLEILLAIAFNGTQQQLQAAGHVQIGPLVTSSSCRHHVIIMSSSCRHHVVIMSSIIECYACQSLPARRLV